jgi:hypothetical protein
MGTLSRRRQVRQQPKVLSPTPRATASRCDRLHRSPAVRRIHHVTDDIFVKEELEAAIEVRKEMGAEMEPAAIDAFVARIERRLVERAGQNERAIKRRRDHQKEMVLGSMAISIPLFAIAAVFTGLAGIVAVLVALVLIAVVTARGD